MAIQSYKPGPGTLKLGVAPLDVSCQVTDMAVEPSENVKTSDPLPVLCGEELTGDDEASVTFRLKGNLLQDLAAAGVIDFSWTNSGDEIPFEFVPSTALAREVTGTVRVVPLKIGGPVKQRATSDLDWACIGTPVFGAVV